jgi:hypothetical protein
MWILALAKVVRPAPKPLDPLVKERLARYGMPALAAKKS